MKMFEGLFGKPPEPPQTTGWEEHNLNMAQSRESRANRCVDFKIKWLNSPLRFYINPQSVILTKLLMYDDLFGLNLGLLKSHPQATHELRALQRLAQSWAGTPTGAADSLTLNQQSIFSC